MAGTLPIKPFIVYDMTRLFLAPAHITPRGIDRVDLGYAKHFLAEWPGDAMATLLTPFGVRTIDRQAALGIVEETQAQWKESGQPGDDPLLQRLKSKLIDRTDGPNVIKKGSRGRQIAAMTRQTFRHLGRLIGPSRSHAIPHNAVYINTGQMGIAVPQFLYWLKARPDIRSIFMLHDLIPLQHAEFVPPMSSYFHNNMVSNTVLHAAGLITTTSVMGNAIRQEILRRGRSAIPILSEPLPVSPNFSRGRSQDARLAEVPYFVIVGSIEPRKNHALLLEVWRELVRTEGARAPKLVIAGTRWNGHEAITDAVKHSSLLKDFIIEVGGLSTPALHQLVSNARGLLMPSFAEGFGLPIIEAQALGVPVIASNIAEHREAGGGEAIYLDVRDRAGWTAAIRGVMAAGANVMPRRTIHTWPDYFQRIEPFLTTIAAPQRQGDMANLVFADPEASVA